jgi:hypothetical protein
MLLAHHAGSALIVKFGPQRMACTTMRLRLLSPQRGPPLLKGKTGKGSVMKLNELYCQHRFWMLIAEHAPVVVEDLFARYDAERWTDDQWLEHWKLFGDSGGVMTKIHAAAKAWAERWNLVADWTLMLAHRALTNRLGRTPKQAWANAVSTSVYYLKLPPIEINVWRAGEAWNLPPKEECKRRILEILDNAIDKYYKEWSTKLPHLDFDQVAVKDFDRDSKRLILYLCLGNKDSDIADMENTGARDAPGEGTIRMARTNIAKLLGLRLPERRGRKPQSKARK